MSHDKPTVLLEHYLKELKLPTFLREYKKIAELCQKDRSDYQTFLLRLVEREMQDREIRARERRIKAAKFPVLKTLDTFDFTSMAKKVRFVNCTLQGACLKTSTTAYYSLKAPAGFHSQD